MKKCNECDEYTCGAQGSDNVSQTRGNMKSFDSGAVREDKTGKGRMDLLPMCALIRLSKHYEAGTAAHGERNWEKGIPMHSFLDSALRHLAKYMDGQTDEDHLCAAAWNILGAMWTEEKRPEMQDIPTRPHESHGTVPPLASDTGVGTTIPPETEGQEDAREKLGGVCSCWEERSDWYVSGGAVCTGTREQDPCSCGGDRTKCDFYPEVRAKALKEHAK